MSQKATPTPPQGLTDEQIAQEAKFMEGLSYFNIGAMFMPAIWGPGHGEILTVLFYPMWLFCDNIFYSAYCNPSPLLIIGSIIVFIVMAAVTLLYARLSQPKAWHRAHDKGKTKEQYMAAERKWAVGMAVLAIVLIALATWFNLCVRSGM